MSGPTEQMLIIGKDQVGALKQRLERPGQLESCRAEVRKMIEIKSTLLWRADIACGCVGWGLAARLEAEVTMLQNALRALDEGDAVRGLHWLTEYERLI